MKHEVVTVTVFLIFRHFAFCQAYTYTFNLLMSL